MIVTCVTSRYLPNLRYISRLYEADRTILLDLSPVPNQNKYSFISRNRICERTGKILWLSVPVNRAEVKNIMDVKIDSTNRNWINKHIKSIANAYPAHKIVAGDFLIQLENVLRKSGNRLIDINQNSLDFILGYLKFEKPSLLRQSSLFAEHSKFHRTETAKLFGASSYVAGEVEWDLMAKSGDIGEFDKLQITVKRSRDLNVSEFPPDLVRELSCVHALCTFGPERTRTIIENMLTSLASA